MRIRRLYFLFLLLPTLIQLGSVSGQKNIRTKHVSLGDAEFGCCQLIDSMKVISVIQKTTFIPAKYHSVFIYRTDFNFNLFDSVQITLGGDSILIPRSIEKINNHYIIGGHGGIYGQKDQYDYLFTFGFTIVLDLFFKVTAIKIYSLELDVPYNIYDSKLIPISNGSVIGLFEVRLIADKIYSDNYLNRFNLYCKFNDSMVAVDFRLDSNNYLKDAPVNDCRITNDLVQTKDGDFLGMYMGRISWESGNSMTKKLNDSFMPVSNKSSMPFESQKAYLHYVSNSKVLVASVLYGDSDPFSVSNDVGLQTAFVYWTDTALGYLEYNSSTPLYKSLETIVYYKVEMANHKGLAVDGYGNYYFAYQYTTRYPSETDADTLLIIKCDKSLTHLWSKRFCNPGHNIFLHEINVSKDGSVYLIGTDYAYEKNGLSNGLPDAFIMKMDSSGNILLGNKILQGSDFKIDVYPNPFSDELRIDLPTDNYVGRLINVSGSSIVLIETINGVFNTQNIEPGIYILEITTNRGCDRRKVIKL